MSEKPTVGRIQQLSDKPFVRAPKPGTAKAAAAAEIESLRAEVARLRKLCEELQRETEAILMIEPMDQVHRAWYESLASRLGEAKEGRQA